MINGKLGLEKISASFSKTRRVVIRDFLNKKFAEEVNASFQHLEEEKLWYRHSTKNLNNYNSLLSGETIVRDNFSFRFSSYPLSNISLEEVNSKYERKRIRPNTQHLTVTPTDELPSSHAIVRLVNFLHSSQMSLFISLATSEEAPKASRAIVFASRYHAGDFLTAHSDFADGRRIAFVLNLTKGWLPHWGGQLVVLDDKYEKVLENYVPTFNSLTLFCVPLPHAVSPVSDDCQTPRYAVSGWYP